MDGSILQKLGIDASHLIAQVINFGIVFAALCIFLYKPVVRMLEERKKKITAGLQLAEKAEQKVAEAKHQADTEMAKAREEAASLLNQIRVQQEKEQKRVIAEGRAAIREEFARARTEIKREKEQLFEDVKKKTAVISVNIARQLLKKEVNEKTHQRLIEDAIKKL
jgi:F-type H+-transporting ATPase subunit b